MFRSVILRFVLPVAFASCVVAYVGLPYIQRLLAEWFRADVELRAQLVMHTMEEPIKDLVEKGNEGRLRPYLARITADERLLSIMVCRPDGRTIFRSERTPSTISCDPDVAPRLFTIEVDRASGRMRTDATDPAAGLFHDID